MRKTPDYDRMLDFCNPYVGIFIKRFTDYSEQKV